MNIFALDINPKLAAQYHCDKHVVKMIVETAQILSTSHHVLGTGEDWMYKKTHENHPCCIWARKSKTNFEWLRELGSELCSEYTFRYGKIHATQQKLERFSELSVPDLGLTKFALAMPEYLHSNSEIESYRNYYMCEKSHIATWKNRNIPYWFIHIPHTDLKTTFVL